MCKWRTARQQIKPSGMHLPQFQCSMILRVGGVFGSSVQLCPSLDMDILTKVQIFLLFVRGYEILQPNDASDSGEYFSNSNDIYDENSDNNSGTGIPQSKTCFRVG